MSRQLLCNCFLFLLSVATRAGSLQKHVQITVGPRCVDFGEGGKP